MLIFDKKNAEFPFFIARLLALDGTIVATNIAVVGPHTVATVVASTVATTAVATVGVNTASGMTAADTDTAVRCQCIRYSYCCSITEQKEYE